MGADFWGRISTHIDQHGLIPVRSEKLKKFDVSEYTA
jgi:hypothetical protein